MKKSLWLLVLALMVIALAACGGGAAAPEPQADAPVAEVIEDTAPTDADPEVAEAPAVEEPAAAEPTAEPVEETTAAEPAADEPAEAPAEEAVAGSGMAMSGIDPDTGLEINPPQPVSGVDYIVRGELVSFNLTPQDSPEFLVESPDGVRYRIQSQPVPDIFLDDGTQLKPHEYQRGMMAQATARLQESATATSVMLSENLTILAGEQ
jgi:hypothetical protein